MGVVESGAFSLETSPAVFLYYLRKSVISYLNFWPSENMVVIDDLLLAEFLIVGI